MSYATGNLKNYGASNSRPNGGTFSLPGGANAVQMRSGATGGADIGIFHLSDDNAFVCNSSDNNYTFAVFDTDLTTDFTSEDTASFCVTSNGGNCKIRGNVVLHSGNIGSYTAGAANSVAWSNVSGKPFNWSGQSGQPTWLWGSNDGSNYYVWNPSNFSVNYATYAANAWTGNQAFKIKTGYGINSDNEGMLCYCPADWTAVSSSQWGVGSISVQGVVRTSHSDLIHYRHGAGSYTILDSYNYSSYVGSASSVTWQNVTNTIVEGNEFNIIPNGYYNQRFWFNYRAQGGGTGSFSDYYFGNGNCAGGMGRVYCSELSQSSDRRLKKNISGIDRGELSKLFNVVDKLFKQYTLKEKNQKSYGFIAQELEKYIPEAVSGDIDSRSVSYDKAIVKILASVVNEIKDIKEHLGME